MICIGIFLILYIEYIFSDKFKPIWSLLGTILLSNYNSHLINHSLYNYNRCCELATKWMSQNYPLTVKYVEAQLSLGHLLTLILLKV